MESLSDEDLTTKLVDLAIKLAKNAGEWRKLAKRLAAKADGRAATIRRLTAVRNGWRPMKTAPRNGREVLLMVESRAGMTGECLVGHWMSGGHCIEGHPPIDEGWYFWNGCMFDRASRPVAWAPLPDSEEG